MSGLGNKKIKGKVESVKVYRVIASSSRKSRFDVSTEKGLTPFIGRERELELLLDGFGRAKSGWGQAFSIISEAGMGKSRLLFEFKRAITNQDVTFLGGKCLSYSKNIAYCPVIDILKSTIDILESDGDLEIINKVTEAIKILKVDAASILPYLLELLSVKNSGIDKIPMSPEAKKDRIIKALKSITIKSSESKPLIIALEDLHWIDENSLEYLKDLLNSISGTRIFLIFTYRPQFMQTWGVRSYHSQINLNRLSSRETLIMASNILGKGTFKKELEEFILHKIEGVPFYIEEFIRATKDLKVVEKKDNKFGFVMDIDAVAVPSTIQDVIMARVDVLPENAKKILQTASVIGREFKYELIMKLTTLPEKELLSYLSILKDSELIYERGIYSESTFIFKHALTQEVVYDSILKNIKKNLHENTGRAIEQLYKDGIDEYYNVLTEHYRTSENHEKSAEFSMLAGKKTRKTASFSDAINYAQIAISSLESLSQTDDVKKKIIDTRATLALYFLPMNYHVEAKEAVEPIIELTCQLNYKRRLSQIYTVIGSYNYTVEEDFTKAIKNLQNALKISEELNDILSIVMATYWLGLAQSLNCEFEKALYYLRKALEINKAANILWGMSSILSSICAFVYNRQGKIDLSYQTSCKALNMAEESNDIYSKALAYTHHGSTLYYKGMFKTAEEHLLKGVELSLRLKMYTCAAMAYGYLGDTDFEMGEYEKSQEHISASNSLLEKCKIAPSWVNKNKICIVKAKIMNHENITDTKIFNNYMQKNRFKIYHGWIPRNIAETLLNMDVRHIDVAEHWILKAIDGDKNNGMMCYLGMDYAIYSKILKRKNEITKSKENLVKALSILKECGANGRVKNIEQELSAIS